MEAEIVGCRARLCRQGRQMFHPQDAHGPDKARGVRSASCRWMHCSPGYEPNPCTGPVRGWPGCQVTFKAIREGFTTGWGQKGRVKSRCSQRGGP